MPITQVPHTSVAGKRLCFFHILEDLTIPFQGRETALAWVSVSTAQDVENTGEKKVGRDGKIGGSWQGGEEQRMMKNKAKACVDANG